MAHRAAIYTVRVHEKGKPREPLSLGDIDEQGTYLGDVLHGLFDAPLVAEADQKQARCSRTDLAGEDLRLSFQVGESGLVADIIGPNEQLRLRQEEEDTQLVRCDSLFRLPRNQRLGWWAVHHNHGRSPKSLVYGELEERFRAQYEDLMLVIQPAVMASALRAAVADGRLNSVKLVKLARPSDFEDANKWVSEGDYAKVELRLRARERGKRLLPDRVQRAIEGDEQARVEVIEFGGLHFDEAKLQVTLRNGLERTFNLHGPQGGHPFTEDIAPTMQDGEPTDESTWNELGRVLTEMG